MAYDGKLCFKLICCLATILLVSFCIYIYGKGEDLSEISYKTFNQDTMSLYPSVAMCFLNPFKEALLKDVEGGINGNTYTSFLLGRHWNESLLNINFERVTYHLQDYIVSAMAYYSIDPEQLHNIEIKSIDEYTFPTFLGMYKCISFNMPNENKDRIILASITIRNSIFPNGSRPRRDRFLVMFHYPNQSFRNVIASKWIWPQRNDVSSNTSYLDTFCLKSMEVLHRRNKFHDHCEYRHNFDDELTTKIMLNVGCVPPYWNSNQNLPRCKSKEQLNSFYNIVYNISHGYSVESKYTLQPCVDLQKLVFDFEEQEEDIEQMGYCAPQEKILQNESYTTICTGFLESNFKEIKKVRAFGIESLVGNVGGYVGLFLGFSIIQLPTFFMVLVRKLQTSYESSKSTKINFPMIEENCNKCVSTEQQLCDISALNDRMHSLEEKMDSVVSLVSKYYAEQC